MFASYYSLIAIAAAGDIEAALRAAGPPPPAHGRGGEGLPLRRRDLLARPGAAAAGEYIFKPTKESMERHLLPVFRNKVKILPSKLKEGSVAIIGASALVWKEMEKAK